MPIIAGRASAAYGAGFGKSVGGTPFLGPYGAFDALASVTVPSGGLSSIVFTGMPSTYKHFEVRGTFLASAANEDCLVRLDGDTDTNYAWHELRGDGSSASARGVANTAFMYLGANSGDTTNPFAFNFSILDANSTTKFKTFKSYSGQDRNGGGGISQFAGHWRGFSSVSTITIYMASGTFNQHSQFAIYGVK